MHSTVFHCEPFKKDKAIITWCDQYLFGWFEIRSSLRGSSPVMWPSHFAPTPAYKLIGSEILILKYCNTLSRTLDGSNSSVESACLFICTNYALEPSRPIIAIAFNLKCTKHKIELLCYSLTLSPKFGIYKIVEKSVIQTALFTYNRKSYLSHWKPINAWQDSCLIVIFRFTEWL